MSLRDKPLSAVVVGTGFIGPVHVEGLRRPAAVSHVRPRSS